MMIECIQDKKGRYVIVKGVIQGTVISILNVYYPPAHPSDFITKVFLDFSEIHSDIAIVGGDFNCILNPLIDRLPHKDAPLSTQAKSLSSICEDLGFVDVWRTIHPLDKEYTFFSAPHLCHTRIDYFFIPGPSLHSVLSCSMGSILISDHANVVLDLSLRGMVSRSRADPNARDSSEFGITGLFTMDRMGLERSQRDWCSEGKVVKRQTGR